MSLNAEERKQLARTLYHHVEETCATRQDLREFYDYLIEKYEKEGLDTFSTSDRDAFLELVEGAL